MNVLYFTSLVLALSVSCVCILGKQWIREFQKDVAVSPCDAARVRQMRFDSLETWKVPQIMATLPVILLIALMLFFAGLLVQLWSVSDQTTAAAVTVVVILTFALVIVMTVIPACVSMRPRRSAFAPFRSPQAWIFFCAYRGLELWCHRRFKLWNQSPPILSSWAEFDLHFLKIESRHWFDHEFSSVHRVLRWVFEVLCNRSEMEKSLLWCLQSSFHPEELVKSEAGLARHVLFGFDKVTSDNLNRLYYKYTNRNEGRHRLNNPSSQRQVELLVRSAHYALDNVSNDPQGAWDDIYYSCGKLWYCHIFDDYSGQDIVHCKSPHHNPGRFKYT